MMKHFIPSCLVLFAASAALGANSGDGAPKGYPSIAEITKGGGCVSKDNTARILKSAHPLDFSPHWSNENYIGTGWTFLPKRYVETELDGGIFLQGDLLSARGSVTDKNVFVLFNEWKCGG